MSGFTRRYLQDPGLAELLAIEGVVIIDREPAAAIIGTGSGVVCCVGEFEKGPVGKPIEVFGGQDVLNTFGGFGFTYSGVGGNNPCARGRKADGATKFEYWNGNGYVALASKNFARLILVRVDTSVGVVSFTRLASIIGGSDFSWNLEPGQVLTTKVDTVSHTVTWDAAKAAHTGSAGTYPTTFAGGETITITIDNGTPQQIGPVVVTFTSADTSQALSMARINAALGYTAASDGTGGKITLTGNVRGTAGNVVISQISTLAASALGLTVSTTNGTGDVANIDTVTFAEVKSRIEADATGTLVERDSQGRLVVSSIATTGTPAIEIVSSTTTALAFGFTMDVSYTPTTVGVDGTLSAGTLVTDTAGTHAWVTTDDVAVTAGSAGPYSVKVRPATDDGTGLAALPGAVTVVAAMPADLGVWSVTNVLALTAALSESAIDAAYIAAIDSTKNPNSVAKQDNIIFCARQSNAVRVRLRSNALDASKALSGRIAIVRPPLGTTTRSIAMSDTLQPGVGAYRDQRVVYAYPGGRVNIPQIGALGLNGGAGFTADGNIDVGSDSWLASICSQLPPEENPGQQTNFAANLLGIEAGNPDVQDLEEPDYRAFRAAGIAGLRMDDGVAIFQSGVTAVDPSIYPGLRNIARRRMADFIQDSIATGLKPFTKKLNSRTRRTLVIGMIEGFMGGLVSSKNPDNQRIDSYKSNYKSGNTAESVAAGLYRIVLKAKTLPGMDVIVVDTEIGEGVLTVTAA